MSEQPTLCKTNSINVEITKRFEDQPRKSNKVMKEGKYLFIE